MAAAREDLAITRERLRRSQDEDLANASENLRIAISDLKEAQAEIVTLTAARDALKLRMLEEAATARDASTAAEAAAKEASQNAAAVVRRSMAEQLDALERAAAERLAATEASSRAEFKALEEKLSQELDEALSLAKSTSAEARAASQEREAMILELEGARERLLVADGGRVTAEAAAAAANKEKSDLERRLGSMEQEVRRINGLGKGWAWKTDEVAV